jgi:hypothetical protein
VGTDVGHDQERHWDGAFASIGLGRREERLATGYHAELSGDADGLVVAIDVSALESGQFSHRKPQKQARRMSALYRGPIASAMA